MTLTNLHEATGLSHRTLSEALLSLTAEGQAVLSPTPHTTGEGPKQRQKKTTPIREEVTSAWGRDEDGSLVAVQRFRRDTVFVLNEKFLNDLPSDR